MVQIETISDLREQLNNMRAIIFRLDNILYPVDDYVRSGFRQISRLFLGQEQEVYDQLWVAYAAQDISDEDWDNIAVKKAIRIMLRQNNLDSKELATKCLRIYMQHKPEIQLHEGVEEMLKELREHGFRLGMVTDGPPEMQREKIRTLGLVPLFDEIIITDAMAGHGDVKKFRTPNDICYEIMCLRLGVPLTRMKCVKAQRIDRDISKNKD